MMNDKAIIFTISMISNTQQYTQTLLFLRLTLGKGRIATLQFYAPRNQLTVIQNQFSGFQT